MSERNAGSEAWQAYKKTMVKAVDLWSAARTNDVDAMATLLESGAELEAKDTRGYTPLMLAAYHGHIEAARFLIARGADVNARDAAGNSVLMGVAFKGHLQLARALIDAGADVEARNHGGQTATMIARAFGRSDVVVLIADHAH